ncbi:glutaredoxin family protein [Actinomyces wuliandei]|uniref:glutaredoxin family protein n=1 Tax=Actinomyces wuliandei TaxID=2057743 RepID=UPI0011199693|nr:glutaredoxin family protein [Actinomyces wuliandei]
MSHATVYTRPGCPQCDATTTRMDRQGITYTLRDVRDQQAAAEARRVAQHTGTSQLPLVTAQGRAWSGYRPDHIDALTRPQRTTTPAPTTTPRT